MDESECGGNCNLQRMCGGGLENTSSRKKRRLTYPLSGTFSTRENAWRNFAGKGLLKYHSTRQTFKLLAL